MQPARVVPLDRAGLVWLSIPNFGGQFERFPGGKTLGNKDNVKLRFDPAYMAMAAEDKL